MATKAAIKDFEVEELCDFLSSSGELSEEAIGKFRSNRISGGIFFDLDDADLKELLPILGDRKVIQRIIKSYQPPSQTPSAPQTRQETNVTDLSWISSCIPDNFSRRTRAGIEKGVLTKGQKVEIIETVAHRVLAHTEYPTSHEYNAICQTLITKYPNIKDTIGNGYGSWKMQLRTKFKNLRRRPDHVLPSSVTESERQEKESSSSTRSDSQDKEASGSKQDKERAGQSMPIDIDEGSYEENMTLLEEEYKKSKTSHKVLKSIMKSTLEGRRKWILEEAPSVSDIIDKFPPLKRVKYLERELFLVACQSDSWDSTAIKARWSTFAAKFQLFAELESRSNKNVRELLSAHKSEKSSIPLESPALELLETIQSLEIVSSLMAPRAKVNLIHRFPMDCNLEEAVLGLSENHGYLAMVISDSSFQVFLTAERCVLGTPNNSVSVIVALMGVYFSFNMVYPKPLYPICIFLQHFVLDIVDGQKVPDVVKRVVSSLDRIDS